MNDLIITIGRQNGSGGREVGKKISEILGIKYYDQEIIAVTANESGLPVDEVAKEEERSKDSPLYFWGVSAPNPVFVAQSKAICDMAENGPAVFVGRCADYILRDRKNVVNVFVHAPLEDRMERSAKRNGIPIKEAAKRVQDKDRERAMYYQRYTRQMWGVVTGYHLSVNTGPIGIENAADLVIEYVRMMGYPD